MALDYSDKTTHRMDAFNTGPQSHNGSPSAGSLAAEFEKAAASALENVERYVRENPVTTAVGVGAAGLLIALAISSRRSAQQPLDRRLLNELNRHSEDVVRAVRRNANSLANSDTGQAIETFLSQVVNRLIKVPDAVSKQVSELTK